MHDSRVMWFYSVFGVTVIKSHLCVYSCVFFNLTNLTFFFCHLSMSSKDYKKGAYIGSILSKSNKATSTLIWKTRLSN